MTIPVHKEAEVPPTDEDTSSGVNRRTFLSFLVAAPVLTVGARVAHALIKVPQVSDLLDVADLGRALFQSTQGMVLIQVALDGTVTLFLHRTEVGQGITTAMAMLVAEELGLQPEQVKVPLRDATIALETNQITMASLSVTCLYDPVRKAAAGVRDRLIAAAAARWTLPAASLTVANGNVVAPDGRTASFGSLTEEAATVSSEGITGTPKPTNQQTVIGRPTPRIEGRAIVTGQQKYTMDLDVPGAVRTMVRRPPTIKGTVTAILNQAAVAAMPGVVGVVQLPSGVAVAAETFGQAQAACAALQITWAAGAAATHSDATIESKLKSLSPSLPNLNLLVQHVELDFYWNMVSLSPMEVTCAIADVRTASAEIWGGFKIPNAVLRDVAQQLGLPNAAVTVHVIPSGGSFGRRLFYEAALEAAQVSQALGRPVKLMWSRFDETRHGRVRPASFHRARVVLLGKDVIAYQHHVSGMTTDVSQGLGDTLSELTGASTGPALTTAIFNLLMRCPYNFGVVAATILEQNFPLNTTTYRAPWTNTFRPAEEIIVDAIAKRFNEDPYLFRKRFLINAKSKAVLDKVAQDGQWGRAMPPGHAQGIAVHEVGATYTAWLVEIDCTNPAQPRVTKAIGAVDVGHPINPSGIEQQMLGGLADGITVLSAGVHLQNGKILEASFADFRYVRQANYPREVRIHVLPSSTGEPSGVAEHGLPGAAAAVANAYGRATNTSPRRFPINFNVDFTPEPA